MEKYNQDIRDELTAARNALNTRLDALTELERNGAKYKPENLKALQASISTDEGWKGNKRPAPVEE